MDMNRDNKLVVGASDKKIHIFDYKQSLQRLEERESTLKYQLRSIAAMPDGNGYVYGTVEGRASWEYTYSVSYTHLTLPTNREV